jgi:hypothetical protein
VLYVRAKVKYEMSMDRTARQSHASPIGKALLFLGAVAAATILVVVLTTPAPILRVKVLLCANYPEMAKKLEIRIQDDFGIVGNRRKFSQVEFIEIDTFIADTMSAAFSANNKGCVAAERSGAGKHAHG